MLEQLLAQTKPASSGGGDFQQLIEAAPNMNHEQLQRAVQSLKTTLELGQTTLSALRVVEAIEKVMSRPGRVLLVGFQDQDNLGLRYLASSLRAAGHDIRIESFGTNPCPLLQVVDQWTPDVVGFSLIFQFMAPHFARVIAALRAAGATAHFTIGGHYASFSPDTVLHLIPELDSVVRFAGERTIVELTSALVRASRGATSEGLPGGTVPGPVHRPAPGCDRAGCAAWPDRTDIAYDEQELATASVLASRGCPRSAPSVRSRRSTRATEARGRRRRDRSGSWRKPSTSYGVRGSPARPVPG